VTREAFERELATLRESLLRMGGLVEAEIDDALAALRSFDREAADVVRMNDHAVNDMLREIREQVLQVTATQQPVASDLRLLMGVQFVAIELERMGDYAVRIARRTATLAGLPHAPLFPELRLMGQLASQQVRDILDALVEEDAARAHEVAAKDAEIDRLYDRIFDMLIDGSGAELNAEESLRTVLLINVAHTLERIGDRVVNMAEDVIFLDSGDVVELG
jgi:phosphate transport system protein